MGHAEVILEHLAKAEVSQRQRKAGERLAAYLPLIDPFQVIAIEYNKSCERAGKPNNESLKDLLQYELEHPGKGKPVTVATSVIARACGYVGINIETASIEDFETAAEKFRDKLSAEYKG